MSNYAAWTGEAPEPVEAAASPPALAEWTRDLPDVSLESFREAERAARAQEQERATAAQNRADNAENQALVRRLCGTPVETLQEVLDRRMAEADRFAGRQDFQRRKDAGEVSLIDPPVQRSAPGWGPGWVRRARDDGWPGSAFEADRLIRQARDLHSDLVAYEARRRGTTFDQAMAARGASRYQPVRAGGRDYVYDKEHGDIESWSAYAAREAAAHGGGGEISRVTETGFVIR